MTLETRNNSAEPVSELQFGFLPRVVVLGYLLATVLIIKEGIC